MKKGLLALFAAVTLCGVTSSYASAPIVSNLPDVTISEQEDNIGTDNNFFVFTNAFRFDDFVSDDQTTESDLAWTFDEGDPATQWFAINGKAPVHLGSTQMAADNPTPDAQHNVAQGTSKELRGVSAYASFRDVVFTPGSTLPPAYPEPSADHSAGKVVQYFVSNGTTVTASNLTIVNSIDNVTTVFDSTSGGSKFVPVMRDKFITDPTTDPNGWIKAGDGDGTPGRTFGLGQGMAYDYDSVNQALRIRTFSASTDSSGKAIRTRIGGWYALFPDVVMPYSAVGTGNIVRAKYWIYATGQATSASNQIPCFQLRVGSGFSPISNLEISTHLNDISSNEALYAEVSPSKDPSKPSLYRNDYDPIDTSLANGVDITRSFTVQALDPEDNGYLCMAENVIGTYPASLLADANGTVLKSYTAAAGDLDIHIGGGADPTGESTYIAYDVLTNTSTDEGALQQAQLTGSDIPTISYSNATGITMNCAAVPSNKIGVDQAYVSKTKFGANALSTVPRVKPDKQYRFRFHLTSTQASNRQAAFWLFGRAVDFAWVQQLEYGGAWVQDDPNDAGNKYNWQINPGTGNAWASGLYDVLMYTPLSLDIRPDKTGALSARMPLLSGQPDQGVNSASFKDIQNAIFMIDSFNQINPRAQQFEQGQFSLDSVEVREYPAVLD